jgi:endonuclease IV
MKLHIGKHIAHEGKKHLRDEIKLEFKKAQDNGFNISAMQIFVMGPQSFKLSIDKEDKDYLLELTKKHIKVYVHSSYYSTLKGTPQAVGTIKKQLKECDAIGASGLVVHLPHNGNLTDDDIIQTLEKLDLQNYTTRLYLEIAVTKTPEYAQPATIKRLFKKIPKQTRAKLGLCIDTCHVFSSGIDLSSFKDARDYLEQYNSFECPIIFHLNDSKKPIGSFMDRHAKLGSEIWKHYKDNWHASGLYYILKYAEKHHHDIILEWRADYITDFRIISKMIPEIRL